MRALLYVMHVDWRWIRQRPHFLASELAEHFDVRVAYCKYYRRKNLVPNERDERLAYRELLRIPARFTEAPLIARLNEWLLSAQVGSLERRIASEYVWVGSPPLYPAVEPFLDGKKLIYDCMDDCAGFGSARARARAESAERALLERADLVLVSSARLREVVAARGYRGAPVLVNNALAPHLLSTNVPPRVRAPTEPFVLFYFGTVGHWFDFDGVRSVLDRFPSVTIRIAGPAEVAIPAHPRIEHIGVVPHGALPGLAASCDALIMPFVVNDLVKGVDPVKLYEYICFRRNIIAPDYAEIRKFDGFVQRYASLKALEHIVEGLLADNTLRYSDREAREFLAEHTWSARARQVVDAIERI